VIYATPKNASKGLSKLIAAAAADAIKAKGSFSLVLSGGSVLTTLSALAETGIDWSKVWVFFVDERNVAHDSPDSNYLGAHEALLGHVPIPKEQVRGTLTHPPRATRLTLSCLVGAQQSSLTRCTCHPSPCTFTDQTTYSNQPTHQPTRSLPSRRASP
jgi:6-phosphogluconolactonase/glucosamine-6-phosphate isomerase/deaminase